VDLIKAGNRGNGWGGGGEKNGSAQASDRTQRMLVGIFQEVAQELQRRHFRCHAMAVQQAFANTVGTVIANV
jgi:hypothetical protein